MTKKRSFLTLVTLALALFFMQAPLGSAGEVGDEKAAGRLEEIGNGYLKPGPNANSGTPSVVERINRLRKEHYQEIAQRNKVPLQAVEMSAGQKLLQP